MGVRLKSLLAQHWRDVLEALGTAREVMLREGPSKIQFWFIALLLGSAAGLVTIGFRSAISLLQKTLYGVDDPNNLHSFAETLPWYWIVAIPTIGGLVVGLILKRFTDDGRVRSVADVIEGAALHNGRVNRKAGLASGLASLITLSSGGSTGREGPVVHLSATISSWVSEKLQADGITGRDLLGCAVAAAVAASFNAPIAGALFALEVILRHFAVHAFAPIAIASVAGAVISRITFGDVTEFMLPADNILVFYVELPAFVLLGVVCGLVAVLMMRAVFWADDIGNHIQGELKLPRWLRPAVAGLALGLIATAFPHIIGVGYETTSSALTGTLGLREVVIFAIIKAIAVAITIAGRMGGGIFSPSMMMGALTGLGFGIVATSIFPTISGSETLYALAGMGAVAAAVLGAPISTSLIVFELTGDWQTGLAVLVAVSISTALASRLVDRSFFLTQLERVNIHVAAGPQAYLLTLYKAGVVMRGFDHPKAASREACEALVETGFFIDPDTTLEVALPKLEETGHSFIPVMAPDGADGKPALVGALFRVDALATYNQALAATAAEEHS